MSLEITRWSSSASPDPERLLAELRTSGWGYSTWSNGPEDRYAVHSHAFRKHLVCLRGSITFTFPGTGESVELAAGDALDLPPATPHGAVVGPEGVECAEAHMPPG